MRAPPAAACAPPTPRRAMIEEQYAKRLAALAKATLGRDEIGCVLPFVCCGWGRR